MKKFVFILSLLIFPLIGYSQDNVKVDNKKLKEKKGAMNNDEIKKSRKQMDKQGKKFDQSKYNVPVRDKGKGDKQKQDKAPAKKGDKGKM